MAVVEVDYEVARDAYKRLLETLQDADAERISCAVRLGSSAGSWTAHDYQ